MSVDVVGERSVLGDTKLVVPPLSISTMPRIDWQVLKATENVELGKGLRSSLKRHPMHLVSKAPQERLVGVRVGIYKAWYGHESIAI